MISTLKRGLISLAAALVLCASPKAWAGCTTATAVSTSSTQILAANDINNSALVNPGRHFLSCTNSGPDMAYIGIGTSNAVTSANGIMILLGETLNWPQVAPANGAIQGPPNGDVSAISYNGGGNTTANVVCCDY